MDWVTNWPRWSREAGHSGLQFDTRRRKKGESKTRWKWAAGWTCEENRGKFKIKWKRKWVADWTRGRQPSLASGSSLLPSTSSSRWVTSPYNSSSSGTLLKFYMVYGISLSFNQFFRNTSCLGSYQTFCWTGSLWLCAARISFSSLIWISCSLLGFWRVGYSGGRKQDQGTQAKPASLSPFHQSSN